jgi:hypothetical protein
MLQCEKMAMGRRFQVGGATEKRKHSTGVVADG